MLGAALGQPHLAGSAEDLPHAGRLAREAELPYATLALATIVGRCQIGSLGDDFPFTVPFTTVAGGPVPAMVLKR